LIPDSGILLILLILLILSKILRYLEAHRCAYRSTK
jgi:hypothetical protein